MDELIQKFEANLLGKIPDSAFTDEEIVELYDRTLNAVANKMSEQNPSTFQVHDTKQ